MIKDLHHIGIAVRSLSEAMAHYVDGLGLEFEAIEDVAEDRVRVAILRAGATRIELLEATDEESPVAKFIAKRGPGVHHLAFEVEDTGEVVKVLTAAGAPLIDSEARPGAHGTQVAFIHPKYLGGVLAELVSEAQ